MGSPKAPAAGGSHKAPGGRGSGGGEAFAPNPPKAPEATGCWSGVPGEKPGGGARERAKATSAEWAAEEEERRAQAARRELQGSKKGECRLHAPDVVLAARIRAVLDAGSVVALRQWPRAEIAYAAELLGVEQRRLDDAGGEVSRGREPVCRDLLAEARLRSGGRRAGLGDP